MIIKFSETEKIITAEGSIWDYYINKEVGLAYEQLNMRGPKSGQYLDKACHSIYFIIEGKAVFYIDGIKHEVREKDVVVVEPNTPHYIETKGLKFIAITRPDWYEEQHELVK